MPARWPQPEMQRKGQLARLERLPAAVGYAVVAWRRRAVPVSTAPVVRGDLLVRVLCDGRLEPPEGGEVRLADGGTLGSIASLPPLPAPTAQAVAAQR